MLRLIGLAIPFCLTLPILGWQEPVPKPNFNGPGNSTLPKAKQMSKKISSGKSIRSRVKSLSKRLRSANPPVLRSVPSGSPVSSMITAKNDCHDVLPGHHARSDA